MAKCELCGRDNFDEWWACVDCHILVEKEFLTNIERHLAQLMEIVSFECGKDTICFYEEDAKKLSCMLRPK